MASQPRIAIIGGGVAGPALALALKKYHGMASTIYELREVPEDRVVNVAMAPNGCRVLDELGVLDSLRQYGYTYDELLFSNAGMSHLGNLLHGSEREYGYSALRIHRTAMQQFLTKEARALGVSVKVGKKLVDMDDDGSIVKLKFEDGEVVETDIVIGADGVHSKIRPHVTKSTTYYSGFTGIIGSNVDATSLHESSKKVSFPNFCFGGTGFVAMMPCSFDGKKMDFFTTMPSREHSREGWIEINKDKDGLKRELCSRFSKEAGWPGYITQHFAECDPAVLDHYAFYEVPPLDRWSAPTGRAILIGDSAHAFTPQGGQGASMGLEDARTLAYVLSRPAFQSGKVADMDTRLRLLSAWGKHRAERLVGVKAMTDLNGRLRTPDNFIVQYCKEWLIWTNFKLKGSTLGMHWLFSYEPSSIVPLLEAAE